MRHVLRILPLLTYPLLGLSCILIAGTLFSIAFIADFTVENRTSQVISVTPVGTVGKDGERSPLPAVVFASLPLPATRAGGFRLDPGQAVTVRFDMDDINFSEIVVEDSGGRQVQLVVNPDPTANQYHAPIQRLFVIDDLQSLGPVDPPVAAAAQRAQGLQAGAVILNALIILPWLAYAGIRFALARSIPPAPRIPDLPPKAPVHPS